MTPRLPLAFALLACTALAGCARGGGSEASAADAAACTKAADAVYQAQNEDAYSRTLQNGVRYSATPNQVFDAQRLGSLHQRDTQITRCEAYGSASAVPGPPPVTPHIVP